MFYRSSFFVLVISLGLSGNAQAKLFKEMAQLFERMDSFHEQLIHQQMSLADFFEGEKNNALDAAPISFDQQTPSSFTIDAEPDEANQKLKIVIHAHVDGSKPVKAQVDNHSLTMELSGLFGEAKVVIGENFVQWQVQSEITTTDEKGTILNKSLQSSSMHFSIPPIDITSVEDISIEQAEKSITISVPRRQSKSPHTIPIIKK